MVEDSSGTAEKTITDVLREVSGFRGISTARSLVRQQVVDSESEAEVRKQEANQLFAEGRYEEALEAYRSALESFKDYSSSMLDAHSTKLIALLYSNMAQTLLKCPQVKDATTSGARIMADKSLALDPVNVKARFRRGCAFANSEDWDLARADFEWVLQMDPFNEPARSKLRSLARMEKANSVSSRSVRAGMAAALVNPNRLRGIASSESEEQSVQTSAPPSVKALLSNAFDSTKLDALVEDGFVVVGLGALLRSQAILLRLRAELEACDAAGVTRTVGPGVNTVLAESCRSGTVRHATLQAHYQGSSLQEISDVFRALPLLLVEGYRTAFNERTPSTRESALKPSDSRLRDLAVPESLQIMVAEHSSSKLAVGRHLDSEVALSCAWTALLFVNPSWQPGDGGEVRIFDTPDEAASPLREVEPRAGQFVLLDSRRIWYDMAAVNSLLPTMLMRCLFTLR